MIELDVVEFRPLRRLKNDHIRGENGPQPPWGPFTCWSNDVEEETEEERGKRRK